MAGLELESCLPVGKTRRSESARHRRGSPVSSYSTCNDSENTSTLLRHDERFQVGAQSRGFKLHIAPTRSHKVVHHVFVGRDVWSLLGLLRRVGSPRRMAAVCGLRVGVSESQRLAASQRWWQCVAASKRSLCDLRNTTTRRFSVHPLVQYCTGKGMSCGYRSGRELLFTACGSSGSSPRSACDSLVRAPLRGRVSMGQYHVLYVVRASLSKRGALEH